MRPLLLALSLLLGAAAPAAGPLAFERDGDVYYTAADGSVRQLTRDGGYEDVALAPDGRTIAFLHRDGEATGELQGPPRSLWIADVASGSSRKLLEPKHDDRPERDLASFQGPVFSLDGGFVYVQAQAWATSSAIHQVAVADGRERFVVDGWLYGVLRNGPYRGFLVVGQHRYFGPPHYGSYNPVSVVRPDGKAVLRVPGSEKDDGEESLGRWLKAKGWRL